MIFITTYRFKPFLSKDEAKELLGVFTDKGVGAGVTAHYYAADGSGGVVISEQDSATAMYETIVNYGPWVEYQTKPFLTIEEAVPLIAAWLG